MSEMVESVDQLRLIIFQLIVKFMIIGFSSQYTWLLFHLASSLKGQRSVYVFSVFVPLLVL